MSITERVRGFKLGAATAVILAACACIQFALNPLPVGHHHQTENDASPCLICAFASAPAVQCAATAGLFFPGIAAAPTFSDSTRLVSRVAPGSDAIRAPPLC